MADEFVNMVVFKAKGYEEMALDLDKLQGSMDSLTKTGKQFSDSITSTSRSLPTMDRSLRNSHTSVRERARAVEELTRKQQVLNRVMEVAARAQRAVGFFDRVATYAGSAAGRVAGGIARGMTGERAGQVLGGITTGVGAVGAGALGLGLSGLSGTVPMARFQNQLQRLSWELGNTLTPIMERLTRATAAAANWLNRRTESEQNMIGQAVLGAAAIGGAKVLGLPVGAAARGIGQASMSGLRGLGALTNTGRIAPPAALTEAEMIAIRRYGNLPGQTGGAFAPELAASGGMGLSRFSRVAGRLGIAGAGLSLASNIYGEIAGSPAIRARRGTSTPEELAPARAEYSSLKQYTGEELKNRVAAERWLLRRQEKAATETPEGLMKFEPTEQDKKQLMEVRQRRQVLDAIEQNAQNKKNDHRANAFVGGQFREIGAGYYEAASAYAQAGFGKKEGENFGEGSTLEENVARIAEAVGSFVKGKDQPPPPVPNEQLRGIPVFG